MEKLNQNPKTLMEENHFQDLPKTMELFHIKICQQTFISDQNDK